MNSSSGKDFDTASLASSQVPLIAYEDHKITSAQKNAASARELNYTWVEDTGKIIRPKDPNSKLTRLSNLFKPSVVKKAEKMEEERWAREDPVQYDEHGNEIPRTKKILHQVIVPNGMDGAGGRI